MATNERKTQLLDIGAKLASKHGHVNVTRRMVATAAKVSEALVSSYMGDAKTAQAAYKRRATKLGLKLPTADQAEVLGAKLRAHGPRKAPVVRRKRSEREKAAIKRNIAAMGAKGVAAKKSPAGAAATRATAGRTKSARSPAETAKPARVAGTLPWNEPPLAGEALRTAARAPLPPPINPEQAPLPLPVI